MTLEELKPLLIETFKKRFTRIKQRRSNESNLVTFYRARCIVDGCNNETITQSSKLKKVSGKCVSCAAKKRPYEWAFSQIKARNRNPRFSGSNTMSYKEVIELMKKGNCEYCGSLITRLPHIEADNKPALLLDRKDSSIGYTYNNCATCCWRCNEMKSDFYSYEEFKAIILLLKRDFNW